MTIPTIPNSISFPSGITILDPLGRLTTFLSEEFEYYDEIPDVSPNAIVPLDVLVATGINAFIGNAGAVRIRKVHRGMATKCNLGLAAMAPYLDLTSMSTLDPIVDIVAEACTVDTVLSAVATKVLHRKRRNAIPLIDSVMAKHCCSKPVANLLAASNVPPQTLKRALDTFLDVVRTDLQKTHSELCALQQAVAQTGWPVTPLRIHDILVWTENEPTGYYRNKHMPPPTLASTGSPDRGPEAAPEGDGSP